ncbi:MAG: hypothetical protein IJ804_01080 [Prevotella sp.]|nr:hypothetical protein [Prevotella sp.]
MKRILSIAVALVATITAGAQNIAVVSPSNSTKIYQTLDEAIINAENKSIIYLPGGGFQVTDNAKIDKQLTIMGVSHRGDTDNADGATIISGNLNFIKGSSHSAVMGVYVSGNVVLTDSIANFTMRYCNVNSVQVKSSKSGGMIINQCYLRNTSDFGNCNVKLSNNIMHSAKNINAGTISHNVITNNARVLKSGSSIYYENFALADVNNSTITYNFILDGSSNHRGSTCTILNNCRGTVAWNDNPVVLPENTKWDDVFKANKGVTIASDYHLSDTWAKSKDPDLTGIGIYGSSGNDFSDAALAPIPRIVSKKVSETTDAFGQLEVTVTVKGN